MQTLSAAPIRVLIVDDSPQMLRVIRTLLEKERGIEVAGVARPGLEALDAARRLQPDVITMDIARPDVDGMAALKNLRRVSQAAVLMVSSQTSAGSIATLTALRLGASDFVTKDSPSATINLARFERDLLEKIRELGRDRRERPAVRKWTTECDTQVPAYATMRTEIPRLRAGDFDMLLIGTNTGGPPVLEYILSYLKPEFPLPILISLPMPQLFTLILAERLNGISHLTVQHSEDGMLLEKGHVYLAQGGNHLRVRKSGSYGYQLEVSGEPAAAISRPSADELLRSGAEACGARALGLMLTGIGSDGAQGAQAVCAAGGKMLAQDRDSCVVYGMPKAVAEAGLALASLSPRDITATLNAMLPS